jgi:hypothetical protein
MTDTPDGKRDFFVSYTSSDELWAEWIAWIVEEAGCESALKWDPGRFPGKLLNRQAVSGRQVGPDRRRSGPT